MNAEEEKMIGRLLSPESSSAQQASALTWFAQFFEEDYILDLPRSDRALNCLEDFASLSGIDAKHKKRALRLHKKYRN